MPSSNRPRRYVKAAGGVAANSGFPTTANDGVKGYLSEKAFRVVPRARPPEVLVARPEYLLAMKCLAMRRAEFTTLDDVRFLSVSRYPLVQSGPQM